MLLFILLYFLFSAYDPFQTSPVKYKRRGQSKHKPYSRRKSTHGRGSGPSTAGASWMAGSGQLVPILPKLEPEAYQTP